MFGIPITERGHRIIQDYIKEGDTAVDCTAGRGEDTLFLAERVGKNGTVYALDIQEEAIDGLHRRFDEAYPQVIICRANNRDFEKCLSREGRGSAPQIIMYNLGYLPGGDHSLTTRAEDTLQSVRAACDSVKRGGLISAIAYPGHPEGAVEAEQIEAFLRALPPRDYEVLTIRQTNRSAFAPVQHLIFRKK